MLLEHALDRYLVQLAANGRSRHTIDQARRHVRLLDGWLHAEGRTRDLDELDHEDVAMFLASGVVRLREDGAPRKPSSANALRSSLRSFLRYAFEAGFAPGNPGRLVRRARCGPRAPRAMTDVEQGRLRAALSNARTAAEKRDRALFELMLSSGLRVGSAVALRIEDAELESGELRVSTMKGGREQVVRVSPEVVALLEEQIGERRRGWIFKGNGGGPLTPRHVQRRLQVWLERAGIKRAFSPHSLRHSFATGLYRETRDLLLVREAMGHASILSTALYAHEPLIDRASSASTLVLRSASSDLSPTENPKHD